MEDRNTAARRSEGKSLLALIQNHELLTFFPLQIFNNVTLFFSQGIPNFAKVIPAMDTIDEKLTTGVVNFLLDPSIYIALSLGKKTLERYYSKTNEIEAYRIYMSKFIIISIMY